MKNKLQRLPCIVSIKNEGKYATLSLITGKDKFEVMVDPKALGQLLMGTNLLTYTQHTKI
ncbi:hypothetical protein BcepSauron_194 [Burkholderia phage BcepSauron]|uniref:Uncharacterized protein n=1 Tax=Burkholderia phage BcepSauron TaxID=2530033 RepID=A0A482MLA8_9CAUD|nr:hypothetical protein H1O17_gp194 [Burkholderia phage BcepSauron]QBQ74574.1 hypothetical protein BcepSauron_194 [Burkholderia phage BcepSauron]